MKKILTAFLFASLIATLLFQCSMLAPVFATSSISNCVCDHWNNNYYLGNIRDLWTGSAVTGYYNSGTHYFNTVDKWYEGGYGSNSIHAYVYHAQGPLSQYWSLPAQGSGTVYDYSTTNYVWGLQWDGSIACYGYRLDHTYYGVYAVGSASATVKADDTFNLGDGSYYTQYGSYCTINCPGSSPQLAAKSSPSSLTQSRQSTQCAPMFNVQVNYAYVGQRTQHLTLPDPFQNQTSINAASLYPSLICFNVTQTSNAAIASCDAQIEVYQIQVTTDTGTTENYLLTVGTNVNPAFSNLSELSLLRPNIENFTNDKVNRIEGYFTMNSTIGGSFSETRIGSLGSYQSSPSTLGFWSSGQPNAITVSIHRLGDILLNGTTANNYYSTPQSTVNQIQLAKFGDGFLYNMVVPQDKLQQIDTFSPPI